MTETAQTRDADAAAWVVRLNSDQCTRADETAFREWIAQHPARAEAFAEHHALWTGVGALADSEEARALLLPQGVETPVSGISRRVLVGTGIGAIAAGVIATVVTPDLLRGQRYDTAPGEQKTLHLADGSTVVLNTASGLRVDLGARERRLFLDKGQAFFQVAKDVTRPFRVFVGNYEVRALGTAFDVRRIGDDARVTLEEGRVAIYHGADTTIESVTVAARKPNGPRPAAVLKPGEQAVIASAEPISVGQADLKKAEAWRYGQMVLDGTALGEIVADLNRYGGPQIVLSDASLETIRVSGVFHTGRPDVFVEAVTTAFPVRVVEKTPDRIVLAPR